MAGCAQIRPLLYPYLEREAGPGEAMDVASHLSDCTACKILLARKRRLGRMLEEGLEDSIPVGEDFVRSVMATLPDGPPPPTPRSARKRGLKLAVWIGLALATGLAHFRSLAPVRHAVRRRSRCRRSTFPAEREPSAASSIGCAGRAWPTRRSSAVRPSSCRCPGLGMAFGAVAATTLLVGVIGASALAGVAMRSLRSSSRT